MIRRLIVVLAVLLFLVAILLVIVVASSILLALGTGLALVFPVRPFETTVVVIVVAIVVIVAWWLIGTSIGETEENVGEEREQKRADRILDSVPLVKPHGGKKRRR